VVLQEVPRNCVWPESAPHTNIHVLVGRNAVGKTYLLNHMSLAFVDQRADSGDVGAYVYDKDHFDSGLFSNLVSVTFSAFDDFPPLSEGQNRAEGLQYAYIGLKRRVRSPRAESLGTKDPSALSREFASSVRVCSRGPRLSRWRRALDTLETDPIFQAADISSIADAQVADDETEAANSNVHGAVPWRGNR